MIYLDSWATIVGDALRFVAPTFLGKKHLAENTTPPRYVWERTGDTPKGASALGTYLGEQSQPLGELVCGVRVHCWGESERGAERLRMLLLVAAASNIPQQYLTIGRADWIESQNIQHGSVCIQELTFSIPISDMHIPQSESDNEQDCYVYAIIRDIPVEPG